MELCEKGSVEALLKKLTTLEESMIAPIVKGVCHGLAYLHERLIVHRDVKPGNILLSRDGDIKLGDFGISSKGRSRMSTMIGTPYYLAPEVILSEELGGYGQKIDEWALGICIITMADGQPPFSTANPMRALFLISTAVEAPTLQQPVEKYSIEMRQTLEKLLIRDAEQRISAKETLLLPWIASAADRLPPDVIAAMATVTTKIRKLRPGDVEGPTRIVRASSIDTADSDDDNSSVVVTSRAVDAATTSTNDDETTDEDASLLIPPTPSIAPNERTEMEVLRSWVFFNA